MRYLVIETYLHGAEPVYRRASNKGRMLPADVRFLDSWVEASTLRRCFQLIDADDAALLSPWIEAWSDLVKFEVVEVVDSTAAAARFGLAVKPDRSARGGPV